MSSRPAPAYPAIHITGDSFTGGLYATSGQSYRELLQPLLQGVNAANAGSYTQWAITGGKMADQIGYEVTVFPQVDLLIIALGQNDMPSRSVEQFEADTITCFTWIKANLTSQVIVVAIPFGPYWHGTATGAKGLQFNAVLKAQAESRGFFWAPSWEIALTWAGIAQAGDVPTYATAADNYHPNNTGHQQLLAALWEGSAAHGEQGHAQAGGRQPQPGQWAQPGSREGNGVKIWLDVETAPGAKAGPGPVVEITAFRSTARLDRAGQWEATVPALDARAMQLLQPKRTVLAWAIINGEQRLIGGGPIDDLTVNLRGDAPSLTVTGLDLLGELTGVSVGIGAIYNGYGLLAGLLPPPWIMLPLAGAPSWYMRYSHESWLGAMVEAAGRVGFHFRLAPRPGSPRWIELFATAAASGVVAIANGDGLALERNQNACAITSINETRSAADLANVLYVYGSGDGDARLTLAAATQWPNGTSLSLQYTDEDGNAWGVDRSLSKLVCVSSRAAYGSYEAPVSFADIAPLSNTTPDMQAAANFLLAAAIQAGRRMVVPQYTYRLTVAGLRKQVLPGQTIRVQARRYIDGQRPIDIDRNLVILEVGTAVDATGVRADDLTVSTLDQWPVTDASMVASTIREVQAAAAHPQMSASVDTISYREPIDDDHPASLPFWLGSEVTTVSQVLLRFRTDPLRSTIRAVAGTSSTSGASSRNTTLSDNAYHGHDFSLGNSVVGNNVYYNPGIHALVCSGGGNVGVDATNANHTHGMEHTHNVTPVVAITYGIYEDSSPYAAPALEWAVNGATVYAPAASDGSGWYSLDITSMVMDPATFRPLRADNAISVSVRGTSRNERRVQVTAQVSLRTVIQAVGYQA